MDSVVDVLAHPARRSVLDALRGNEGMSVERLAEAALDVDHAAWDGSDRGRAVAVLHHVHLPKMADAGLVDHDPQTGLVRANANAELADANLHRFTDASEGAT